MSAAQQLPCGCVMGDVPLPEGGSAFVYQPCSLDCEYFLYTQKAAAEANKPMRTMDLRGEAVALPAQKCPTCSADLGMVQDMANQGATPSPGDWTICSKCAAMLVFGAGLALRVPTEEELADAPVQLNVVQNRLMERRR